MSFTPLDLALHEQLSCYLELVCVVCRSTNYVPCFDINRSTLQLVQNPWTRNAGTLHEGISYATNYTRAVT